MHKPKFIIDLNTMIRVKFVIQLIKKKLKNVSTSFNHLDSSTVPPFSHYLIFPFYNIYFNYCINFFHEEEKHHFKQFNT